MKKLLILFLALFMALSFSGIALACSTSIVEFRTQPDAMLPPEDQIVVQPSDHFTVYVYLDFTPKHNDTSVYLWKFH
jgi:hypothetical protein